MVFFQQRLLLYQSIFSQFFHLFLLQGLYLFYIFLILLQNNLNEYLNFDLVWNTGIGFGLFNLEAGIGYHLITIFIFLVIGMILFFIMRTKNFEKVSYAIVLGGAIGNFYDRII